MHVSLDSALGRQRRLNSVGESVLQIAPNAAAAYSLRSLTGGDPRVVRVRRASDNGERDFTSSEIATGEMVSWVNQQVIAPLDIQALEADGRTGDFLIAKAAYALRSLGTRQATLAATGDTVARANGKFVVQVRRSSDDALKSFTADEITDGTLLAFVGTGGSDNGFVKTWYDQSVTNEAGDTATGNHAVQATAASQPKIVNAGSLLTDGIDFDGTDQVGLVTGSFSLTQAFTTFSVSHTDDASTTLGIWATAASATSNFNTASFFRNDDGLAVNAGTTLTTAGTIDYVADRTYLQTNVVNGGSSSIFVDGATGATGNAGSTNPSGVLIIGYFKSGSYLNLDGAIKEFIIYDTDQTDNRLAIEANIGETYSIAGIPAYANTVNGFVETWYDQSGNGNDATQATASLQPKIVDAGSLLTDGIDFDGTSQAGLVTGSFSLTQAFTTFSVSHTDDASTTLGIWATAASATSNFNTASFFRNDDGLAVNAGTTLTTAGTIDYVADRTYLQTNVVNGGSSSIFVDGATGATGNAGSTNPSGVLIIGYFKSGSYLNLDGAIKEFIIYDTDQTDNRLAIEANIGETYSIAGIPAYANTVNGFVETWYDQSGNGKDATQLTAANQPKIVDAGNLVANGLGFFTNDLLETASLGASQPITAFSVFTQDSASSTIYGSSGSHALITSSSNTISLNAGTALVSSASITVGTPALVSSLANSTSSFIFINGGNTTTGNAGTTGITGSLKLGSTNSNRAMEGELQEFIIYNSDQTANRIAIETNINSHYDIF